MKKKKLTMDKEIQKEIVRLDLKVNTLEKELEKMKETLSDLYQQASSVPNPLNTQRRPLRW